MSAFVCSTRTIAAIASNLTATFNAGYDDGISAADFAENLLKQNLRSVGWKYHRTPASACKEFTGKNMKTLTKEVREAAEKFDEKIAPERLWGAVACYTYQSGEGPDRVRKTVTYKTVENYEIVLAALCEQKGVDREGWDL